MKKKHTPKREGVKLGLATVRGESGQTYLVLKATKGSYHVFAEVDAKEAGRDCRGSGSNTRTVWNSALSRHGIEL